jgi:hypothetical protein
VKRFLLCLDKFLFKTSSSAPVVVSPFWQMLPTISNRKEMHVQLWKIIGYQMTNDGTSFRNHGLFHIYYLEEELLGWKNIEQNN